MFLSRKSDRVDDQISSAEMLSAFKVDVPLDNKSGVSGMAGWYDGSIHGTSGEYQISIYNRSRNSIVLKTKFCIRFMNEANRCLEELITVKRKKPFEAEYVNGLKVKAYINARSGQVGLS